MLGVILFSVLAKHSLICRIWTFQLTLDHPLGLAGRASVLGWYRGAWVLHWVRHSFGLGKWDGEPIFLTPSVTPQPLCADCVGKGCNSSRIGCDFHVSAWGWVSQGLLAVICLIIMMTLWVSHLFFTFPSVPFDFFRRLPLS